MYLRYAGAPVDDLPSSPGGSSAAFDQGRGVWGHWEWIVLLCGFAFLILRQARSSRSSRSSAAPERALRPDYQIHYAAKTERGPAQHRNADYFSIDEDERRFLITNGAGAAGAEASKRAAKAFAEFYDKARDPDATWPHPFDARLSYEENRIAGGLRWANTALHGGPQRATGVAAVVHGGAISIGHVGVDRAYLLRDGQIRQLTQDHTLLEEYRRDHPDASPSELTQLPRKRVVSRVLGRRPSIDVDVTTTEIVDGDRVVLCSEGVQRSIDDRTILDIVGRRGLETADLEATVMALIARAQRSGTEDTTVILLAFVAKSD